MKAREDEVAREWGWLHEAINTVARTLAHDDGSGLAEARGFEPPVPVSEYNDLANRRLKPLGHASVGESYKQGTTRDQAQLGMPRPSAVVGLLVDFGGTENQALPLPDSCCRKACKRGCGRGTERLWSAALQACVLRSCIRQNTAAWSITHAILPRWGVAKW